MKLSSHGYFHPISRPISRFRSRPVQRLTSQFELSDLSAVMLLQRVLRSYIGERQGNERKYEHAPALINRRDSTGRFSQSRLLIRAGASKYVVLISVRTYMTTVLVHKITVRTHTLSLNFHTAQSVIASPSLWLCHLFVPIELHRV